MTYGEKYIGDWPYMEPNAQEQAREREEAIVDVMAEALEHGLTCPGCGEPSAAHGTCELLRAWAEGQV